MLKQTKLQNQIILVALKNLPWKLRAYRALEFKNRDQDQPLIFHLEKLIQIYSKIS